MIETRKNSKRVHPADGPLEKALPIPAPPRGERRR